MHAAGIAATLGGLFAFYGVEFFQYLGRDGEVIVLEFENRLWVVQQDVRIEDESLYFPCDLELRLKGGTPRSGVPSMWISCEELCKFLADC